jgi:hypothetical protein
VSFLDVACNISIFMTSSAGADAVTPWENYWVVNVGGQTLVGGSSSTVTVDEVEVMGENLVDVNETIQCDECLHPQPKQGKGNKGKGKHQHGRKLAKGGKRAPAFANSKLYDEQANGQSLM